MVLCFFLCVACYFDYRYSRIPNWLIGLTMMVGIGNAIFENGFSAILWFLLRCTLTVVLLYPLFRIGTVGAGDVKLFGVCAGFLPADKVLFFLLFALLVSAGISMLRFLFEPDIKERFHYLFAYLYGVAESGKWKLYFEDKQEQKRASICLAGPILISILLYIGGLY